MAPFNRIAPDSIFGYFFCPSPFPATFLVFPLSAGVIVQNVLSHRARFLFLKCLLICCIVCLLGQQHGIWNYECIDYFTQYSLGLSGYEQPTTTGSCATTRPGRSRSREVIVGELWRSSPERELPWHHISCWKSKNTCSQDSFGIKEWIFQVFSFQLHEYDSNSTFERYRALLYGGLLESQQHEIALKGISAAAFRVLLKYVYTGCISLGSMKVRCRSKHPFCRGQNNRPWHCRRNC